MLLSIGVKSSHCSNDQNLNLSWLQAVPRNQSEEIFKKKWCIKRKQQCPSLFISTLFLSLPHWSLYPLTQIRFPFQVTAQKGSCNRSSLVLQTKKYTTFLLSKWAGLKWNHMEHIFPLRFDDNAPRQCRLRQRKWLNCILWCVCFSF